MTCTQCKATLLPPEVAVYGGYCENCFAVRSSQQLSREDSDKVTVRNPKTGQVATVPKGKYNDRHRYKGRGNKR